MGDYLKVCFTENENLTERFFMFHELNVKLRKIDPSEIVELNRDSENRILIASTNPFQWQTVLKDLRASSVIFFLLGNETYSPDLFNSLNDLPSIAHVFLYNPPNRPLFRNQILSLLGDLIDCAIIKDYSLFKSSFTDFRASFGLYQKHRETNIRFPYTSFPQGYSAAFYEGLGNFVSLNSRRPTSLLDLARHNISQSRNIRDCNVSFIGQKTNRRRNLSLRILSLFPDTHIEYRDSFGGIKHTGDLTYIESLFKSRFIAVPPGYFNNQNHRYLESIIMGAIPLILSNNSIDATPTSHWTKSLGLLTSKSFYLLTRKALTLSENQEQEILKNEVARLSLEIAMVRQRLDELITSV